MLKAETRVVDDHRVLDSSPSRFLARFLIYNCHPPFQDHLSTPILFDTSQRTDIILHTPLLVCPYLLISPHSQPKITPSLAASPKSHTDLSGIKLTLSASFPSPRASCFPENNYIFAWISQIPNITSSAPSRRPFTSSPSDRNIRAQIPQLVLPAYHYPALVLHQALRSGHIRNKEIR